MIEKLVKAVRDRQVILFVGAGVSRSLGLPSWREMLDEMGRELGFDPDVFNVQGEYLQLAEYYHIQRNSLGSLRAEMDRSWHKDEERVDSSPVHQAILGLRVPAIYTTNYDRWLEIAFKRAGRPYVKVANVGDFSRIKESETQIVKFHGDFDDEKSLVLTETSYFDRLAFESPLDIKLRADAIGKSILFVGYSLTDINIRYMLFKLHRLWTESPYVSARPASYIFMSRPNAVQEAIFVNRGITPVISQHEDSASGLADFLKGLAAEAWDTAT